MSSKMMAVLMSVLLVSFSAGAQKDKDKNLEVYQVDPAHSSVVFGIDHLGFSNVYGMFNKISGEFSFPKDKPEQLKLKVLVDASSIDTGVDKRDEHLRSPDFFNVKQFPNITFESTKVEKLKGEKYRLSGNMALHGITKPVTLEFTKFRTGKDQEGKMRTGGETRFKLKRSDYGMNFMQGKDMVGDEVEMIISLEGVKK